VASKFFGTSSPSWHAINQLGGSGLWDESDGFYYDQLRVHGATIPLKVRSWVGLIPLFAVENLEQHHIERLPGFSKRLNWVPAQSPRPGRHTAYMEGRSDDGHKRRLLALPSRERLERVLRYMLDEREFLSPHGIRSLSKIHQTAPLRARSERHSATRRLRPGGG